MPSNRLPLASLLVALSAAGCRGRAESTYETAIVRSVERAVGEIQAAAPDENAAPRRDAFHHFEPGMLRAPVRPIDSRAGFIYTPTVVLAELGSGERIVVCALGEDHYHVYRLAPFKVAWTAICPHDLNYVATPPDAKPPPGGP